MSKPTTPTGGWQPKKLDDLAAFINGRAFRPRDWGQSGLPIVRIEQINDPAASTDYFDGPVAPDHLVVDGDLLFSWSATLTTTIWQWGPGILNQHIFKVVPKGSNDLRFLHHLLDFQMGALASQSHGSTMKHITRSDLLPFEVAVPSPSQQRRIAEIIDTADAAIQETEALIDKLKLMRAGLLHDLLTRGIDEKGELRDQKACPAAPQTYPQKQNPLPPGWHRMCLKDLTLKIVDGVHLTPAYKEQGIPFLTVENLTGGPAISFHDSRRIDAAAHRAYRKRADPGPGDVLVTKDGTLGVARVVPHDSPEFSIFVSVALIRPNPDLVLSNFVGLFFDSSSFRNQLGTLSAGTGLKHIHLEHFRKFLLDIPPLSEQERILAALQAQAVRFDAEVALLEKVRLVRNGIMHDLFTGRVRVDPTKETESAKK